MSLTCSACLDARPWRCIGAGCARWERERVKVPARRATAARRSAKPRKPRAATPSGRKRTGRPSGSMRGVTQDQAHSMARMLLDGVLNHAEIGRVMHVTYDQVRTVLRQLQVLDGR